MTLQVVSSDLRTGAVLAYLPTVLFDYPLRRTIGQYDSGAAHLFLAGAPENWQRATLEGGAVLHIYDDVDPTQALIWDGIVITATDNTATDVVDLTLVTGEAYADRRYPGDLSFPATGQNSILASLANVLVDGATPGIPLSMRAVTPGSGTLRDEFYFDSDNVTVYARWQQLMALLGGVEWTMQWEWSPDKRFITPVLIYGDRIGQPAAPGLAPATLWQMPGCVQQASRVRDYSAGKGANNVTAYSNGQGSGPDDVPTSGPQLAPDFGGRPTFEFRWNPVSSETDPVKLAEYARQAGAILAPGARVITMTGALAAAPQVGVDWGLGDDLAYQLGGFDDQGKDTVLAFPRGGIRGTGRAIAYQLEQDAITPILAQAEVYTEAAG